MSPHQNPGPQPPAFSSGCHDPPSTPPSFPDATTGGGRQSIFFRTSTALAYISVGLIIGYLCRNPEPTLSAYGIVPARPVPDAIFTDRHDVEFRPDWDFIGNSDAADKHWRELLGAADSVFADDERASEEDRFGGEAAAYRANEYVLTPLRQLRCLNAIRVRLGADVGDAGAADDHDKTMTEYCLEYLRLTAVCGEYWTVEPRLLPEPARAGGELYAAEFGWGLRHSCVDWQGLSRWRDARAAERHDATQPP
ncbi:hypothetical protein SLS58_006551 [Diplodia intermedia]|uniref:Uncharacterized protein n=1 Tax=Diplodia intermedia TaxID=856260 RepID=A0ABR3TMT9_9PEZI